MSGTSHRRASIVIASLAAFFLAGCSPKTDAPLSLQPIRGLKLARVADQPLAASDGAVGVVRAKESAAISAQVVARVASVLAHEGDRVRAGQTLIRLDNAEARSGVDRTQAEIAACQHQLEAARTQSDLAASTLARYRVLRDSKSVSPQEFDEVAHRAQAADAQFEAAQAQVEAAKAAASGARSLAAYAQIVAPFAGIITARHVDPGAMASPGVPLLEIDRAGALQLQVPLDESLLQRVKIGGMIGANVPSASPQPFRARIAEIVPAADPGSHTFLVKLDLPPSPALRSGMYGAAAIGGCSQKTLAIPQDAVVKHGSLASVWVVDASHIASLRYVTLGANLGQNIEILSGLGVGESVVLSAGDRELAGSRIEVRP